MLFFSTKKEVIVKQIMLILPVLVFTTTAAAEPLAYDDFNSYSPGSNLLSQPAWSELFSSDDPQVSSTEAYTGMGNTVVGLNEGAYASARYALTSGSIDITEQEVFITGIMKCETISDPANDDGLYMGLANSNASKLEIRVMDSRDYVMVTGSDQPYTARTIPESADPNGFEAGKTYLIVAQITPIVDSTTSVEIRVGFTEFTGYPLGSEISYQAYYSSFDVTNHHVFSSVLFYPRGVGHHIDHMFVGETWADVQDPGPYVPPVYPDQMVAYYPMDEDSGIIAPDRSGFANDATANASDITWTYGQVAAGCQLNGCEFNNGPIERLTNRTGISISGWFKPTATDTGYRGAFATRGITDNTGFDQNWGIAFDGDHWECRTSGAASDSTTILGAEDINKWYHVVQVWSADDAETMLWINGEVDRTDPMAGVSTINSCSDWPLGDDMDRRFAGVIDELAIWNYALDPNDVKDIYNDGLIGIGADGNTPGGPPDPPCWTIPLFLFNADDVIFSKEPGFGNGGFEDLFDYVEDHPDTDYPYNEPFRIFCEGFAGAGDVNPLDHLNANWCTIDDGGWTASIVWQGYTGNPAGWETPMYNPGYPQRQYEGESHFLVQVSQEVLLESDYQVDATMIADGDNLVVEWFSYMASGTADITAFLVFNKGTVNEYEVEVGTVLEDSGTYTKRSTNYVMVGTASTLDIKLLLDSNDGQLRIDNVQVTRSPYYEINEDAPGNVASVPIKLLKDPGQDITLNVSTQSHIEAVVKYTTKPEFCYFMDDVDVTEVTFTGGAGGNWNVEQNIVVTSLTNDTIEGDRPMIFKIADPNPAADPNILPSVDYFTVKIIDNEFPSLEVVDPNVIVGEHGNGPNGQSDTFKVKLGGVSSSNIQVNFVDDNDPDDVTVTASVEFTPAGIATGVKKTVTIAAIDDGTPEVLQHGTTISISASAVAGDLNPDQDYIDAFPVGTVDIIIYDADCGSEGHESLILDITGDCYVTLDDFAELGARWLDCYIPNGSNVAGDCIPTRPY